ncbi:hypothetical protein NQ317_001125 [Molorchus minor]|uniref:CHK kinase-like domain-containing protein n=1 Tax=Molorchus minor TaxID=1323400 RepID=A0ABQ9JHT6_9CUCU|nr:hypothetical protein NQ317_001125 [Molorchus minor]
MTEYKIRNLEEVLAKYLGPDKKIEHVAATAFGQKGENYGNHNEEELHGVAKTIPDNEISRKIFNIQVTCKNEIAMYDTITPTLQEFQREHGVKDIIDYLPDMYGARLNLDGKNEIVDEDAVLILENLTVSVQCGARSGARPKFKEDKDEFSGVPWQGYVNVDRHIGFNLEEAELILKNLATFHSVPLAIKLKKPDVFEKKIKPYLAPFIPPDDPPPNGENKETMTTVILEIFQDSYKCIPYIPKLKRIFEGAKEASKTPPKEPFATVTHGDTWVNNIMLKFKNNKPFKLKFVDFQVCDYKSPGSDLFFFPVLKCPEKSFRGEL